jgi:hypothetical protein
MQFFSQPWVKDHINSVTDDVLACIARRCRSLKFISLWSVSVADDGLKQLVSCCPRLVEIECFTTGTITGAFLADIPAKLPRLKNLHVRGHEPLDASLVKAFTDATSHRVSFQSTLQALRHHLVFTNTQGRL